MNQLPQIPPQAVELEESILGTALLIRENTDIILATAKKEWFYAPAHQLIFTAMQQLAEGNKPIDQLTVIQQLRDTNTLKDAGGDGYIASLTSQSTAHYQHAISIIKDKYDARQLITIGAEISNRAYTTLNPDEVISYADQQLEKLTASTTNPDGGLIIDKMQEVLERLEEIYRSPDKYTGIPTGLPIDEDTGGWQKSDLIIIAARPSMGKTAFIVNNAVYAAANPNPKYQTPVAIFSLEMSSNQLINRIIALKSSVNQTFLRDGKTHPDEFKKVIQIASNEVASLPIIIDDTPAISLQYLKTKARRYKKKHGIGMIIVDYIQLMEGPGQNRNDIVGAVSRGLKAIAKELDIPVIALSQLSRAPEARGGLKKPQLSDLRESGSIEQDADVVAFLWRPEYYGIMEYNGAPTTGVAYVDIAKHRNGPVGESRCNFHKQTGRFSKPGDHLVDKARAGLETITHFNHLDDDQPF